MQQEEKKTISLRELLDTHEFDESLEMVEARLQGRRTSSFSRIKSRVVDRIAGQRGSEVIGHEKAPPTWAVMGNMEQEWQAKQAALLALRAPAKVPEMESLTPWNEDELFTEDIYAFDYKKALARKEQEKQGW